MKERESNVNFDHHSIMPVTDYCVRRVKEIEQKYAVRYGPDYTVGDIFRHSPDEYIKQCLYVTASFVMFLPEGAFGFVINAAQYMIEKIKTSHSSKQ